MKLSNISCTSMVLIVPLLFANRGLVSAEVFVRGRVNPDSWVNIADAVTILGYLFLGQDVPACLDAADTNDDGTVALTDAVFLLNFLFLGGDPLPPPSPDAGVDPTADDLPCARWPITEFSVEPSPLTISWVSQTAQLLVSGKTEGVPVDVHLGSSGTTYASSDLKIAGVYRDGLVEARAPGSATIVVQNGELVAQTRVTILAQGGSSTHHVLAVNDLGMHCMDREFTVFSILPPFNVLHTQVARSEAAGKVSLLDDSQVTVRLSPIADARGSVNSTSVKKTAFWESAHALFGANLEPGQGLLGQYMADDAPSPGPQTLPWEADKGWFKGAGIPITTLDDAGEYNSYPLLRVMAFDGVSGRPLAYTDIVVPVSQEIDCQGCHSTGSVAAKAGFIRWWKDEDLEVQAKKNILTIHDYRSHTILTRSRPVLCAGCHYSAALDLTSAGPNEEQRKHSGLSKAMHTFHGVQKGEGGVPLFPRGASSEATCYRCHPGKTTQCLRGAMRTGAMECNSCHGEMLAVGGIRPLVVGGSLDGQNDGKSRRAWTDMPRCQSCHTGDALDHLAGPQYLQAADGLRFKQAFRIDDESASPILASNKRFAENDSTLFRFSKGHGGVLCEGCHGSAHAEWPNADPAHNDNVAATQLQGHTGTLTECTACHEVASVALGLGGPHGMHPVNDLRWVKGRHGNVWEHQAKECQACHGTDLKVGSPLARASADRVFRIEDHQTVRLTKGQVVTCTLCHSWPRMDD